MEPLVPTEPAEAIFSALNELAVWFINGQRGTTEDPFFHL